MNKVKYIDHISIVSDEAVAVKGSTLTGLMGLKLREFPAKQTYKVYVHIGVTLVQTDEGPLSEIGKGHTMINKHKESIPGLTWRTDT